MFFCSKSVFNPRIRQFIQVYVARPCSYCGFKVTIMMKYLLCSETVSGELKYNIQGFVLGQLYKSLLTDALKLIKMFAEHGCKLQTKRVNVTFKMHHTRRINNCLHLVFFSFRWSNEVNLNAKL